MSLALCSVAYMWGHVLIKSPRSVKFHTVLWVADWWASRHCASMRSREPTTPQSLTAGPTRQSSCSSRDRHIHSQPLDSGSTADIDWADRTMNSPPRISAVDLHLNGVFLFFVRVCTVFVDLEPSISRSTVHSRHLSPAREIQIPPRWFNAGRWILHQRPEFVGSRARAREFPHGRGPHDPRSTAHNQPRHLCIWVFPRALFSN